MKDKASSPLDLVQQENDDGYSIVESLIQQHIANLTGPVFTTNVEGLFEAYLEGLPPHRRQHYNCKTCQKFIEKYGSLKTIIDHGLTHPVIWCGEIIAEKCPRFFQDSFLLMIDRVTKADVTGVFLSSDTVWGTRVTGQWSHLSGCPSDKMVFKKGVKTAEQMMAEKGQDFIMLKRAVNEISMEAIEQAVRVLKADALDRSEKTLGVAEWFLSLREKVYALRGPRKDNLIWLAVATAPPGWCHIRSTMIGTLLDDIGAGMDYETISRRWAQKMHPLQYQRPTAVKEGSIQKAEKIIAEMKASGSLARRFANLEDILNSVWLPRSEGKIELETTGSVFGHLKKKKSNFSEQLKLPPEKMTWNKFSHDVLPDAVRIDFLVPAFGSFFAFVTAENYDAPPLLQWDGLEGFPRNPVSHYLYVNGSHASHWNLMYGKWVAVNAICLDSAQWQKPEQFKHQEGHVHFILNGCYDTKHTVGGSFFPESLRNEFHEIRSVMEAYASQSTISGREEATACGITLQRKHVCDHHFLVHTREGTREYVIDRWE